MKTTKTLSLFFLSLMFLTSCNNDDDVNNSLELNATNFAGNYLLKVYNDDWTETEANGDSKGTMFTADLERSEAILRISLSANGDLTSVSTGDFTSYGTRYTNGVAVNSLIGDGSFRWLTGSMSLNGQDLQVTDSSIPSNVQLRSYTIDEFNADRMVLSGTSIRPGLNPGSTVTFNEYMELERL